MMLLLTGSWMERERQREVTFAFWQLRPGPIFAHYSRRPSHLKIFPAPILCTLSRHIFGLSNTINGTTSNF